MAIFRRKKRQTTAQAVQGKESALMNLTTETDEMRGQGVKGWISALGSSIRTWAKYNKLKAVFTIIVLAVILTTIYYATPYTSVGDFSRLPYFMYTHVFIIGLYIGIKYAESKRAGICCLQIEGQEYFVDNSEIHETEGYGELLYLTDKLGQNFVSKNPKRRGLPATIHLSPGVKELLGFGARGREAITLMNCTVVPTNNKFNDMTIQIKTSQHLEAIVVKKIEMLSSQNNALKNQLDDARDTIQNMASDVYNYQKTIVKQILEVVWEVMRGSMTQQDMVQREIEKRMAGYPFQNPYHQYGMPYQFGAMPWQPQPFTPSWAAERAAVRPEPVKEVIEE